MKSHVTEPLRSRREHVWIRATREPVPGDYAAAAFVLAVLAIIFVVAALGLPPGVPS